MRLASLSYLASLDTFSTICIFDITILTCGCALMHILLEIKTGKFKTDSLNCQLAGPIISQVSEPQNPPISISELYKKSDVETLKLQGVSSCSLVFCF